MLSSYLTIPKKYVAKCVHRLFKKKILVPLIEIEQTTTCCIYFIITKIKILRLQCIIDMDELFLSNNNN